MDILPKVEATSESSDVLKDLKERTKDLEPSPLNPNPFPTIDAKNRQNNLVEMEVLRKRKNFGNLTEDEKVKLRRINNRIAAQNSRERSRIHAVELKKQVKSLTDENIKLSEQCSRLLEINQSLIEENTALNKELDKFRHQEATNMETKIIDSLNVGNDSKKLDLNFSIPNVPISTTNVTQLLPPSSISNEIKREIPDMSTPNNSITLFNHFQRSLLPHLPNDGPSLIQRPNNDNANFIHVQNGTNVVIKEEPLNLVIKEEPLSINPWGIDEAMSSRQPEHPIFPPPQQNTSKYDVPPMLQNIQTRNNDLVQDSIGPSFDIIKQLIEGSNFKANNTNNNNIELLRPNINITQPPLFQGDDASLANSWLQPPTAKANNISSHPDPDDFTKAVENWTKRNLNNQSSVMNSSFLDQSLNKNNLRCSGGGVSEIKKEIDPQNDTNKVQYFPLEFLSSSSKDMWGNITSIPDINNNIDINNNGGNNQRQNQTHIQGEINNSILSPSHVRKQIFDIKTDYDTAQDPNSTSHPSSVSTNSSEAIETASPTDDMVKKVSSLLADTDREIEAEIQRMLNHSEANSNESRSSPSASINVPDSTTS